ncbi:twin-arginine translocation signal domain-containing protein [Chloroflexota bacterium]
MNRREFLKLGGATAAGVVVLGSLGSERTLAQSSKGFPIMKKKRGGEIPSPHPFRMVGKAQSHLLYLLSSYPSGQTLLCLLG